MTIKDFKYVPFALKFKIPFQTSSQIISERKGFLISLCDELSNVSFGECSPFPGLSKETIKDIEKILRDVNVRLIDLSINENISAVEESLSAFNLTPSLQFGLEQAILSLLIKRGKNFVEKSFGKTKLEINVNAVIGFGCVEDILQKIEEKYQKGYNTFKLKIGRENFEDDYKLIERVRKEFNGKIKIRLDANGKWNINNALNYLEQLSQFNIEYIEEPCANLNSLLILSKLSPIPIAADESIRSIDDALEIINSSKVDFIVLKPMIFGGMISSFRLIKEAERQNKKVIISSSFESSVGRSALLFLATFTNHSFAHGFDTSEYFENNIYEDPDKMKTGKINFDINNYPPHFNLSF